MNEEAVFKYCKERIASLNTIQHLADRLKYSDGGAWLKDKFSPPENFFGQINLVCDPDTESNDQWIVLLKRLLTEFGIPFHLFESIDSAEFKKREKDLSDFAKRVSFVELSDYNLVLSLKNEFLPHAIRTFAKTKRKGAIVVDSALPSSTVSDIRKQVGFDPKCIFKGDQPSEHCLSPVVTSCAHFVHENYSMLKPLYDHCSSAVFLLHGKGTFGKWQPKLQSRLSSLGFDVECGEYDFVKQWSFLNPTKLFLKRKIGKVREDFVAFCSRVGDKKKYAVAHSFGSFLLAKAIDGNDLCLNGGLIICGSIATNDMATALVNATGDANKVINEVGNSDPWPAIASGWFVPYGQVGYSGFRSRGINDRFHNEIGHDGFFSDNFMEKYWLPFLSRGEVVNGSSGAMNDNKLRHFLSRIPLEGWYLLTIIVIVLIGGLLGWLFGWSLGIIICATLLAIFFWYL